MKPLSGPDSEMNGQPSVGPCPPGSSQYPPPRGGLFCFPRGSPPSWSPSSQDVGVKAKDPGSAAWTERVQGKCPPSGMQGDPGLGCDGKPDSGHLEGAHSMSH